MFLCKLRGVKFRSSFESLKLCEIQRKRSENSGNFTGYASKYAGAKEFA